MTGLAEALHVLGSPLGLALLIAGTALGIIVGAIPGLTGTMLIALTQNISKPDDNAYQHDDGSCCNITADAKGGGPMGKKSAEEKLMLLAALKRTTSGLNGMAGGAVTDGCDR